MLKKVDMTLPEEPVPFELEEALLRELLLACQDLLDRQQRLGAARGRGINVNHHLRAIRGPCRKSGRSHSREEGRRMVRHSLART